MYFFFHFIKIISSILFCYNEALEVNYKDKKQLLSSLLFHLQDVLVQWKEVSRSAQEISIARCPSFL